jgi:hypothetical protein
MAHWLAVGQGLLIIAASRSHSTTQNSLGLPWMSDRPVAGTSTWQHTAFTRDKHPCSRRDSKPQSQKASGRRPTSLIARPLGSAHFITSNRTWLMLKVQTRFSILKLIWFTDTWVIWQDRFILKGAEKKKSTNHQDCENRYNLCWRISICIGFQLRSRKHKLSLYEARDIYGYNI